jgi:hypothetical protein
MHYEILIGIAIMVIGISTMLQAFLLLHLFKRIEKFEKTLFLKAWLETVEKGESLSDLAYMKEKGMLK